MDQRNQQDENMPTGEAGTVEGPSSSSHGPPANYAGRPAANETSEQANEQVGHKANEAQDAERQTFEQGREQAFAQAETPRERVVHDLGDVAHAARQAGQQLREQDHPGVAQYIDQGAEQLDQLTNYLQQRDVGQLGTVGRVRPIQD